MRKRKTVRLPTDAHSSTMSGPILYLSPDVYSQLWEHIYSTGCANVKGIIWIHLANLSCESLE